MQKIHIICGATASGKSAIALELAKRVDGVIINADSQQLYRDFTMLTARPSAAEEQLAPHRLYGILEAHEASSAAFWLKQAMMETDWALAQNQTPILVGGTGLYMDVFMHGIADIPDIPANIRAQSRSDLEHMGGEAFHARLMAVDPVAAARIHPTDPQRLCRAYEVWLATAKPLTWWQKNTQKPIYDKNLFEVTHVTHEREILYNRINQRTEEMWENGAVEEVQALMDSYPEPPARAALPALKIIGVREIIAYLEGDSTKDETLTAIQQSTRNYAKRQMTWFRNRMKPTK